jgi:hypothetical protein
MEADYNILPSINNSASTDIITFSGAGHGVVYSYIYGFIFNGNVANNCITHTINLFNIKKTFLITYRTLYHEDTHLRKVSALLQQ